MNVATATPPTQSKKQTFKPEKKKFYCLFCDKYYLPKNETRHKQTLCHQASRISFEIYVGLRPPIE